MVNQEKRWDWKHMLYDEMRNWAMWNCANEWYEKKEMIDIEKDAQKGKMIDMKKKDAQMGKECDENDENGLPNVNLPI